MAGVPTHALAVYQELLRHGYSSVQAIGIMANMYFESGINPEASGMDTNGYRSYGLVQWNAASYPSAGSYLTGNVDADIKRQISILASQAGPGSAAARGSTPQQVAGNWAAQFERCQGCQPGGGQYNNRSAFAGTIASWVHSGNWPQQASTTAATDTNPPNYSGSRGGAPTSPGKDQGDSPDVFAGVWSGGFRWITGLTDNPLTNTVTGIASAAKGIGEIGTQLSNMAKLFALLFRPSFWLRVGAFFIGLLVLLLAFRFLKGAFVEN